MVMADRIKSRMAVLGMTQRALAREIGISHQAISKIVSGDTNQTPHIVAIAKALQTIPEYLIGLTDDPSLPESPSENQRRSSPPPAELSTKPEKSNLVKIRQIDLSFGMGSTYLDEPVTAHAREFNREWLRQYSHASPDDLFFAQGIGDSMQPTLMTSDLLLIDTSQKTIRQADHIWAVAYANCGSIKRLRPMPDGGVKILSDNPSVPEEIAYDGELQIIGRVVGVFRKI